MNLGSKILFPIFICALFFDSIKAEQIITTSPLINIDKLEPSYEGLDEKNEIIPSENYLKEKKINNQLKSSQVMLLGLDKITAKSSKLTISINEKKKFGPLEIKILKCSKIELNNKIDNIAYMQVKDLTKNENEQVFIFNGWIFSSDPSLTPFDHAIYNLQLINCTNA